MILSAPPQGLLILHRPCRGCLILRRAPAGAVILRGVSVILREAYLAVEGAGRGRIRRRIGPRQSMSLIGAELFGARSLTVIELSEVPVKDSS